MKNNQVKPKAGAQGEPQVRSSAVLGCAWTQDRLDGSWATGCGELWELNDGTPKENGMKFCPCCGQTLSETPYTESEQTNDEPSESARTNQTVNLQTK